MKKKSIESIVWEHQNVLNVRERLDKMFNLIAKCHVTIGGSYMLKYWCEAFAEREVSDYDFILHVPHENVAKIKEFITLLHIQLDCLDNIRYDDYESCYFGHVNGLKVNVIIKPTDKYCSCSLYEMLEEIIKVKRAWCDKAIKRGRKPRLKDIYDITLYDDWKAENDLPF